MGTANATKHTVRHATIDDMPQLERIFEAGRQIMRANDNPTQWANGYPQRQLLEEDIARKCLYIIEGADGLPHGAFYFAVEDDPTYHVIEDGAWLNDEPYGVIHRIASDGLEHGIFRTALQFALQHTSNVRIDTHADNKPMQNALAREGFQSCGIIYCIDGTPRVAYQLAAPLQR